MLKLLAYLDRLINDKLLRGRFESISGRCYRRTKQGCRFCAGLCWLLGRIDTNHCQKSHERDRQINPSVPRV